MTTYVLKHQILKDKIILCFYVFKLVLNEDILLLKQNK